MDWYSILKFLHVASAICWIGGGVVLMFLGLIAGRRRDTAKQLATIGYVTELGTLWFIPASLATVIFGLAVATIGGLWSNAWVILGLVGFAATFCTGNFILKPAADRIAALGKEGKTDAAVAEGQRLLGVSKFDYVMLFTVVADMVFKPAWSDVWLLGIMAVVLIVGAGLFLVPALGRKPAMA